MTRFWRIATAAGPRWARGDDRLEVLPDGVRLSELLASPGAGFEAWASVPATGELARDAATLLAPIEHQPVWAAGVTFERSRAARREESQDGGDVYDRVFAAERPEVFYKAAGDDVVAPGGNIGIRHDSEWDVPEPELALVLDSAGTIVAYTLGNDVSSRSIEGANPLYLPQAKLYRDSCALGPCLVPAGDVPAWRDLTVTLTIERDGAELFTDTVRLATMRRDPVELARWLVRCQRFSRGVVLLTGTSIVPDPAVTLRAGDVVRIAADAIGTLTNMTHAV